MCRHNIAKVFLANIFAMFNCKLLTLIVREICFSLLTHLFLNACHTFQIWQTGVHEFLVQRFIFDFKFKQNFHNIFSLFLIRE
jgi:hypothetical protein